MNDSVASNIQIVGTDNSGIFQTVDVQSVDKTLFGYNGEVTGLNVYQIIPKVKQLVMSGKCNVGLNRIYAGDITQLTFDSYTWGVNNGSKIFNIISVGSAPAIVQYDYVNQLGNDSSGTITLTANTWAVLANDIAGINKVRITRRLTTSDAITVSIGPPPNNGRSYGIFYIDYLSYYNGIITCPNNAIMYVTSISTYSPTTAANSTVVDVCIMKFEANTGVRYNIFSAETWGVTNHFTAGPDGSLGGYMYPGDAILMYTTSSDTGETNIAYANVVIKYLS